MKEYPTLIAITVQLDLKFNILKNSFSGKRELLLYDSGSQIVILRSAASLSLRNLLEMQIIKPIPDLLSQNPLDQGPRNLCFYNPPGDSDE